MPTKKVPLVIYNSEGRRIVVGDATLSTRDGNVAMVATVLPEYAYLLNSDITRYLSIHHQQQTNQPPIFAVAEESINKSSDSDG